MKIQTTRDISPKVLQRAWALLRCFETIAKRKVETLAVLSHKPLAMALSVLLELKPSLAQGQSHAEDARGQALEKPAAGIVTKNVATDLNQLGKAKPLLALPPSLDLEPWRMPLAKQTTTTRRR